MSGDEETVQTVSILDNVMDKLVQANHNSVASTSSSIPPQMCTLNAVFCNHEIEDNLEIKNENSVKIEPYSSSLRYQLDRIEPPYFSDQISLFQPIKYVFFRKFNIFDFLVI